MAQAQVEARRGARLCGGRHADPSATAGALSAPRHDLGETTRATRQQIPAAAAGPFRSGAGGERGRARGTAAAASRRADRRRVLHELERDLDFEELAAISAKATDLLRGRDGRVGKIRSVGLLERSGRTRHHEVHERPHLGGHELALRVDEDTPPSKPQQLRQHGAPAPRAPTASATSVAGKKAMPSPRSTKRSIKCGSWRKPRRRGRAFYHRITNASARAPRCRSPSSNGAFADPQRGGTAVGGQVGGRGDPINRTRAACVTRGLARAAPWREWPRRSPLAADLLCGWNVSCKRTLGCARAKSASSPAARRRSWAASKRERCRSCRLVLRSTLASARRDRVQHQLRVAVEGLPRLR